MDKIQVQTPKGRCEKLQSVDPARRGRSNVSLIYLLQRPRVSPNSVRGALVKLSTKKNRFPHTFSKAPCSGMQLFRTSRGRVQPPLMLGRPDPLRVLPRGCGYARLAQSMESADINAKELKADGQARLTDSVHLATTPRQEKRRPCYRCGRNHEADQCKFKEAKCHKCGKQGHIAQVCRTATTPPVDRTKRRPYQRRRAGGTKWLEAEMEQWDPLPLFVLSGDAPQPPILVTMSLCNTPVTFEVDTGAAVTVMSGESFHQLLPGHPLHPSSVELKTYTGEPMKVVGETRVDISYQSQEVNSLSLVVVEGSGPSLLGRNWLHHITLDWSNIRTVLLEKDELRKLLQEYAELGTITPVKAKLEVSPSAVPRFHRPRPVAYALKPLVEQELDRLEQAGVLERVDYSDWAAPIVTVPKRDGCVRICGD